MKNCIDVLYHTLSILIMIFYITIEKGMRYNKMRATAWATLIFGFRYKNISDSMYC